jgi:hypothetical protein
MEQVASTLFEDPDRTVIKWHRAVVLAPSNGLTFLQCCCVQAVRDVHCQLSQMFMEALRHVPGSYMCRMQVRWGGREGGVLG